MAGVFKAYDIRGIYGTELTEALARDVGRALVTFLGCRKVAVGRDIRPHSVPLFAALADGMTLQGADVVDLGACSTPMAYYGNGMLGCDAGVMITASHNPGAYNGFKLARGEAVPISGATGIADIERIIAEQAFAPVPARRGVCSTFDVAEAYAAHIRAFADIRRPLRIVADYANAMGIWEAKALAGLPIEITPLYDTPDGTFPNHEANPLDTDTLDDLREAVRKGGYDFGVAFDGDADRAGFVDERGEIIPMDITTALIAEDMLAHNPGAVIFYDLRSSWAVREVIEAAGGRPMMSRVGHAFIKTQMREHDAVFAGELSGHYYFKANYTAESSALATLALANIVSRSGVPLSERVRPIQRYVASGEINTRLGSQADAERVMQALKRAYGSSGRLFELDGVSVEFEDWWFNVRCSNTEPLIRLNLEARTEGTMAAHRDALLAIIRG